MSKWYCTDSDCSQYMRKDGTHYDMIQYVWLDTTARDLENGAPEYCVLRNGIDLNHFTRDEIEQALSTYGYTIPFLKKEYGETAAQDIIAECILEDQIYNDGCVIAEFHTVTQAENFILEYIEK